MFRFLLNWISDYRGDETESFFVGGGHGVVDGEMGCLFAQCDYVFFCSLCSRCPTGWKGIDDPDQVESSYGDV